MTGRRTRGRPPVLGILVLGRRCARARTAGRWIAAVAKSWWSPRVADRSRRGGIIDRRRTGDPVGG